jgi:hypothetical protein
MTLDGDINAGEGTGQGNSGVGVIGYQGISKQATSNNQLLAVAHKLNWQNSILFLMERISSIIILLCYVIMLSVMSGFILVKVPGIFRKIINVFKEFGKLRRY